MKAKFLVFIAAACSCLLISCRKDALPSGPVPVANEATIQKLKTFYQDETDLSGQKKALAPDQGLPDWKHTISSDGKYLVPLTINSHKSNDKYNSSKFLLLTEVNGQLTAQYVYWVSEKSAEAPATELRQVFQRLTDGHTGSLKAGNGTAIAIADIKQPAPDFRRGNSMQYKIAQSPARGSDTTIIANSLPQANCEANGGTLVEIEWWYQEYDNYGNVIYEEYVYSTFECWGIGSGGSGGGGSPTPQQLCAIKMDNFIAQGSPASELVSTVTTYEDAAGINVTYSWLIYKALTWGLMSYEDATISKIPVPRGGYIKEYSSFTHRLITHVGVSIGGTRSYQDLGATINKAQTRAQVRIDFTVTHTIAGCTAGLAVPYNANKEFKIVNDISVE